MSQPYVRYVLGLACLLHHVNISKGNPNGERKKPQMNLIQMARQKLLPRISLKFLKSPINDHDDISSEVGPTTCSKIFQKNPERAWKLNKNPI